MVNFNYTLQCKTAIITAIVYFAITLIDRTYEEGLDIIVENKQTATNPPSFNIVSTRMQTYVAPVKLHKCKR